MVLMDYIDLDGDVPVFGRVHIFRPFDALRCLRLEKHSHPMTLNGHRGPVDPVSERPNDQSRKRSSSCPSKQQKVLESGVGSLGKVNQVLVWPFMALQMQISLPGSPKYLVRKLQGTTLKHEEGLLQYAVRRRPHVSVHWSRNCALELEHIGTR